jgi:hypothetical protein
MGSRAGRSAEGGVRTLAAILERHPVVAVLSGRVERKRFRDDPWPTRRRYASWTKAVG